MAEPWVDEWCARELGARPAEVLFAESEMADVVGVRLEDGREIVVKRRVDEQGRALTCVEVQRALADDGFSCARPLTPAVVRDGFAIHAEQWRPGGTLLRGDSPEVAERYATVLADLMGRLGRLDLGRLTAPLPNPEWVRWNHEGPGPFAPNPRHDARVALVTLPAWIDATARRVQQRLTRSSLPCVIGHADWEAQNLRFDGGGIKVVHDWDSLAWLPEAAVAGAAAGAFASAEIPTVAPLESSAAFLVAYQRSRGRAFTQEETEIAWAAGLWPALHNARAQTLWGQDPVALPALAAQVDARLRLANA